MDINKFVIYMHEIRSQCLFTRAAFQIFNQALQEKQWNGALFAAQAALTSAAQVASLLWPPRARARRRGEILREKLGLPAQHALGDRRFVELWDHADEKFDDWMKRTHGEQVLFDFVGPIRALNIPDLKDDGIYRLYDTETKIFVFRGVGYNMQNLAKAIEEIGRRAEYLLRQILPPQQQPEAETGGEPAPQVQANTAGADIGSVTLPGTEEVAAAASLTDEEADAAGTAQAPGEAAEAAGTAVKDEP